MFKRKRSIILSDVEYRLLINILVDYRNKLLEVNKPAGDVNELLLNIIEASKHRCWR